MLPYTRMSVQPKGTKKFTINIPEALHKALKIRAAKSGKEMTVIVVRLLEAEIKRK